MRRTANRPSMVLALLWMACGWIAPAHGGVVLQTPAGLAPGDQFRFVFLTAGQTTATSSDISYYDSFVQAQAGGATYNGATVTWLAIGSTASVDAIDHIGQTNTPVYRVDGAEVAPNTTTSGLWAGQLQAPIDEDIDGNSNPFVFVWTGTEPNGVGGISGSVLGNPNGANVGFAFSYQSTAWVALTGNAATASNPLYAISDVLTVAQAVPEPSGVLLLCTSGVMVVASVRIRRHRGRRQGPVVEPPDMRR